MDKPRTRIALVTQALLAICSGAVTLGALPITVPDAPVDPQAWRRRLRKAGGRLTPDGRLQWQGHKEPVTPEDHAAVAAAEAKRERKRAARLADPSLPRVEAFGQPCEEVEAIDYGEPPEPGTPAFVSTYRVECAQRRVDALKERHARPRTIARAQRRLDALRLAYVAQRPHPDITTDTAPDTVRP